MLVIFDLSISFIPKAVSFCNLNSNIEITDITYSLSLKITNNIDIANIIGCVSSLFSIEQSNQFFSI